MEAEGVPVLRLSLFWFGWCALHSLLVTVKMNVWLESRGGAVLGLSRIVYNLIAVLTLIPLLLYQFSLPATTLFDWSGTWRACQALLLLYALVMFVGGKRAYAMGYFLGIRQWRAWRAGCEPAELPLRTTGVLRWVRHPWYSGGLALVWAMGAVTDVNLVPRIVLSVYLVVGSLLEERKLLGEIGRTYADYRRRVPMLLPWKGPRS